MNAEKCFHTLYFITTCICSYADDFSSWRNQDRNENISQNKKKAG